jgi:hypothetical protein
MTAIAGHSPSSWPVPWRGFPPDCRVGRPDSCARRNVRQSHS